MKIYVDRDEQYPIYIYTESKCICGKVTDIPEGKLEWLNKVFKDYADAQEYLEELYEKM